MFPSPGTYPKIDPDIYFGVGLNLENIEDTILSKSLLWAFAKNPWRWLHGPPFEGTKATEWGSLIDCLLLTPDRFDDDYIVTPETYPAKASAKKGSPTIQKPWNWNAGYCQRWREEREDDGVGIIKADQLQEAEDAVKRLQNDQVVCSMMDKADTQTAVVGQLPDNESGITSKIKGLIDIVPHREGEFGNALVDLKTTGIMDTPLDLQWTTYKQGYHMQYALYLDLWNAVTGENREEFWTIFQLSTDPHEVVTVPMSQDALLKGRETYMDIHARWCETIKSGKWASPFDEMEELDLPERAYMN